MPFFTVPYCSVLCGVSSEQSLVTIANERDSVSHPIPIQIYAIGEEEEKGTEFSRPMLIAVNVGTTFVYIRYCIFTQTELVN